MSNLSAPSRHVIVARVDNNPGVVSRISGLFTRRGYNIESLVTGVTENPDVYQLVIAVIAAEEELVLMIHQLGRIMEVIDVFAANDRPCVTRELMLMQIACPPEKRADIIKIADAMHFEIAGVGEASLVLQVTGDEARLSVATRTFEHLGLLHTVRSGALTIEQEN